MKKLLTLVLCILMCTAFAACSSASGTLADNSDNSTAVSQPAEADAPAPRPSAALEQTPAAEQPDAPETATVADPSADRRLVKLLEDVVYTAAPGTAGSSMKAALAAADLLDWLSVNLPDTAVMALSVQQFMEEFPDKEEALWAFENIGGVFSAMAGREGADRLLNGAGLTAEDFKMNDETMAAIAGLFDEINRYR